jgi:hypothetical protein
LHLNRANAGLHQALRAMTVPNQAVAPVPQLHALHRGKECVGFCFDGLRQKAAGAVPQNHRQRIIDLVRLTQGNNSAIAHRGVSLLQEVQAGFVTRLDTPPFSCRHHPGSAIARIELHSLFRPDGASLGHVGAVLFGGAQQFF